MGENHHTILISAVLAALVLSPCAQAQEAGGAPDPNPEAAAQAAAEIVDLHCADVAAGKATASAEALAAVAPVLAQVSRVHDASGATYLLYWRGLLNACVGQEERGVEDLEAFLAGVGSDPAYAAQAKQARVRLRRLKGEPAAPDVPQKTVGGVVAGGALLGAGGALAGLSGWQGQLLRDAQASFAAGTRPWSETDGVGQEGDDAAAASNALLVASIGSGVAGAIVIAVTAATGRDQPAVGAALVPLPTGGVALHIGGRW